MKNIFIALLFFLSITLNSFAQEAKDFGLVYKFNPGPSLWISENTTGNTMFNIDKFQGLGIIYHFSDKIALQSNLIFGFVKFSTVYEPDEGSNIDLEEESILVLGIEANLPFYVKKIENVSLFLSPGITLSTAVNNWEDITDEYQDMKYKYFDIGGLFNIGGQATFGRFAVFSSWGIGFQYVSLKLEYEDNDTVWITGPAFSTNQLSVGLIYYVGN